MSASAVGEQPMALLRYLDVVLLALAAPIMVLIGVSASGYGIAAGAWIALRGVGIAVDRATATQGIATRQVSLKLAYMLGRLFALALTVVLVRNAAGRDAGLTALVVIVFAFTVALATSAITRGR
jgi:hypothetical protein